MLVLASLGAYRALTLTLCFTLISQGWKDLLKLADIGEAFQGIAESVEKSEADWREWYDLESPESSPLPHGFGDGLDPFQQLLVQRCLRPDRVYNGVTLFVIHKMGEYYVQPPVLNYMRIFKQSASTTPIVFVLSPGADPESEIKKLAEECDMGKSRLKTLALGQGQGPVAEDMIKSGAQRGFWVLLQVRSLAPPTCAPTPLTHPRSSLRRTATCSPPGSAAWRRCWRRSRSRTRTSASGSPPTPRTSSRWAFCSGHSRLSPSRPTASR